MEKNGPPPTYNSTLKIDYSNSVDFLNANDLTYFENLNIDLDTKECLEDESEIVINHDEIIKKQLNQNYPLLYVLTDSILMILLNIILIILQIIAIKSNAALSHIGSAIWAGTYNLITVTLVIVTSMI